MAREKVVIVGAGGIFRAWIPNIVKEGLEVVGLVDLDMEAATKRARENELDCTVSTDLADVLAKTRPELVVDLTVPAAHCEVTCTALRAGCHVIGEKPMANSMDEARKMVRASEESGKLYMVSQSRRWNDRHITCKQTLENPALGDLTVANCDFYLGAHFSGFRVEMESPLILDMSIHHFDLARMITGKDPVAVYAHEFNPKGSWYKGDVAASCIFEMTDGVVFTYRGSWCAEGYQNSWNGDWQFTCVNGGMKYEQDQTPTACHVTGDGSNRRREELPIEIAKSEKDGMGGALGEMLTYLRTGKMPQCECHDNIKSLAMVFGAMESSRAKARVEIKV